MTNALKWFGRAADERADAGLPVIETAHDADDDLQDHPALPAHVQEFLALKTAAGF